MPKKTKTKPLPKAIFDAELVHPRIMFRCPSCNEPQTMSAYCIQQVSIDKTFTFKCECGKRCTLNSLGPEKKAEAVENTPAPKPPRQAHTALSEHLRMGWGKAVIVDKIAPSQDKDDHYEIKVHVPPSVPKENK